jgi:hypothetical protein
MIKIKKVSLNLLKVSLSLFMVNIIAVIFGEMS